MWRENTAEIRYEGPPESRVSFDSAEKVKEKASEQDLTSRAELLLKFAKVQDPEEFRPSDILLDPTRTCAYRSFELPAVLHDASAITVFTITVSTVAWEYRGFVESALGQAQNNMYVYTGGLFFGKHVDIDPTKEIVVLVRVVEPSMGLLLEEIVHLVHHSCAFAHTGVEWVRIAHPG